MFVRHFNIVNNLKVAETVLMYVNPGHVFLSAIVFNGVYTCTYTFSDLFDSLTYANLGHVFLAACIYWGTCFLICLTV